MKILLHLPHVSLDVPDYFYEGLIIPKPLFRKYNLEMSDLGVEYLSFERSSRNEGKTSLFPLIL